MNDMTLFLDLLLLASGGYCMYTWLRLMITGHLFQNGLLVPKDKKVSDCADEAEYIRAIRPSLGVVSIVTFLYGIVMVLNDRLDTPFIPYPWPFALLAVVLAALVWYGICNSRANRDYCGL